MIFVIVKWKTNELIKGYNDLGDVYQRAKDENARKTKLLFQVYSKAAAEKNVRFLFLFSFIHDFRFYLFLIFICSNFLFCKLSEYFIPAYLWGSSTSRKSKKWNSWIFPKNSFWYDYIRKQRWISLWKVWFFFFSLTIFISIQLTL